MIDYIYIADRSNIFIGNIHIVLGLFFIVIGILLMLKRIYGFPTFFEGIFAGALLLFTISLSTLLTIIIIMISIIIIYIITRGSYTFFNITMDQVVKVCIEKYRNIKVEYSRGYNEFENGSITIDFNDGINEFIVVKGQLNNAKLKLRNIKDIELKKDIIETIKYEINKTKKTNKLNKSVYFSILVGLLYIGLGYMYIVVLANNI